MPPEFQQPAAEPAVSLAMPLPCHMPPDGSVLCLLMLSAATPYPISIFCPAAHDNDMIEFL